MQKPTKGPAMVLGPGEGASYWQPAPHSGYMTVKLGPHNLTTASSRAAFSMGLQVMPAGCHVRAHGHARNDEVFYILEGTGRCVIDGVTHPLEPGLERVVEAAGKPRKAGDTPPQSIERPANIAEVLRNAGYATPEEIARVAQLPDVRQRMEATGNEAVGSTPEDFEAKFKSDVARFRKIVQDAKLPMQD